VRRIATAAGVAALIGLAAWQGAAALQTEAANGVAESSAEPTPEPATPAAERSTTPAPKPKLETETPMAERVAVLGFLNKRNGIARDVTLRPGQAMRIGEAIVRLRACETTADWEPEQLTGAFVQLDVRSRDQQWHRAFSGWLYKETPSLNVVPSPLYDVWPKSCAMRHPDAGPDTVSVSAGAPPRSSAKKSTEDAASPSVGAPATTPPAVNATSSNPI
jgi:hypothetical protein